MSIPHPSLLLNFARWRHAPLGYGWPLSLSRSSAATYVNPVGKLATAPSGVLRHDHNPITGEWLGALNEPQATNIAWYNCAPASFGGPTGLENVSVAAATDPFGTSLALALTENSANSEHRLRLDGFGNSFTLNANTSYVLSAMVKAGPGSRGVKLSLGNASAAEIQINPATGAAQTRLISTGFTSVSAPTVAQYPGGWWEVSAVALVAGSNLTSCNFVPALTSTATGWISNYAGDSSSGAVLFGWGVVAGASRSSIILTPAGSSVTRLADVLTVPVSAFPFSAAAGTVFVDFRPIAAGIQTEILRLYDGVSGGLTLYRKANNTVCWNFGGQETSQVAVVAGQRLSVAACYSGSGDVMVIDGGAVNTKIDSTVPTGITTLALSGAAGGGLAQIGGHIRQIAYFPRRLSNTDLQYLTL